MNDRRSNGYSILSLQFLWGASVIPSCVHTQGAVSVRSIICEVQITLVTLNTAP
jgi:hypothetical protein